MSRQIENVSIGACMVKFGSLELGHTSGPIKVELTRDTAEMTVNEFSAPVDFGLTKEDAVITMDLAETAYLKLQAAFPLSTATSSKLPFGSTAGSTFRSLSDTLFLHPLNRLSSDKSNDLLLHKAVCIGKVDFSFDNTKQKVYTVEFHVLVDDTQDEGNYLGVFGDPS